MVFENYNYIPGYRFSPMTWSVCNTANPWHDLNLLWNDSMMKIQCDSLLYQSPIGGMQGNFFPLFNSDYSTVPYQLAHLTFDQFRQQMNNGFWGNPSLGGFNNGWNPWGGSNPWSNQWNPWGNNGSNGSNGGSNGGTVETKELNSLKSLIDQLKKADGVWTDSMAKDYSEALKKKTNEEKIQAIKEILADIDSEIITKAILDKSDIKEALIKAGYDFNGNSKNDDTMANLSSAHQDLKSGSIDGILQSIANDGEKNGKEILRKLSLWNSEYPEDKGILGMIASKVPDSNRTNWRDAIHNITMQLITKSTEYGDLSSKRDAIKENLKKIDEAFKEGKDKSTIKTLVNKMLPDFNELYCELRIKEAQKINKKIRETYRIDAVSEDIVLASTKSDLESEGFDNVDIKAEKISTPKKTINHSSLKGQPADKQIEALTKGDLLADTEIDGIYSTKTGSANADEKFYGVKDDKLVEYVGVKSADEITEDTQTKEIKDTKDIQKYADAVSKIDELIADGKIKERASINGVRIYYAVDKTDKGWQYFTIRNNRLMEINIDKIINPSTVVMKNGTKKDFSELTDADFKTFSKVHTVEKDTKKDDKKAEEKEDKKEDAGTKTGKESTKNRVKNDFEKRGAEYVGKAAAKKLIGKTKDYEADYVELAMAKLTEDNNKDAVLEYLIGYFKNSGSGNGYFEQIAREHDGRWTNKKMVSFMKLALDAIPEEYQTRDEYYEMLDIYDEYAKIAEEKPNDKFVTSKFFGGLGLGFWNEVGALFGNSKIDDFDDYLSDLLESIGAGAEPTDKKEDKKEE